MVFAHAAYSDNGYAKVHVILVGLLEEGLDSSG